ncbi:hypothetical protein QQG55_23020 [Brugia pahangi]
MDLIFFLSTVDSNSEILLLQDANMEGEIWDVFMFVPRQLLHNSKFSLFKYSGQRHECYVNAIERKPKGS